MNFLTNLNQDQINCLEFANFLIFGPLTLACIYIFELLWPFPLNIFNLLFLKDLILIKNDLNWIKGQTYYFQNSAQNISLSCKLSFCVLYIKLLIYSSTLYIIKIISGLKFSFFLASYIIKLKVLKIVHFPKDFQNLRKNFPEEIFFFKFSKWELAGTRYYIIIKNIFI